MRKVFCSKKKIKKPVKTGFEYNLLEINYKAKTSFTRSAASFKRIAE